jgi:hypothetical protein
LLVFSVIFVQLAATRLVLALAESESVAVRQRRSGGVARARTRSQPLVLSVLLGRNHGLYAAVFVSLWTRLLFGRFDAPLLACALVSGFTAVFLTLQVRRRSRLIRAGFGVGVALWLLSVTFGVIGPIDLFTPAANDWETLAVQSAFAIGNGILTGDHRRRLAPAAGAAVPHHHRHLLARGL